MMGHRALFNDAISIEKGKKETGLTANVNTKFCISIRHYSSVV